LVVAAAAVVAAVVASSASAALFFLFDPTVAKPGDLVAIRLGGTPSTFTLAKRVKPLQAPMRIYLAPTQAANRVRSRFDWRLSFVGELVRDRNGHGLLKFRLPPLDPGTYVPATWCPDCARHSSGRTFFVQPNEDIVPRYQPLMRLEVVMPNAAAACPVTRPDAKPVDFTMYGNGFLSTRVSVDGGLLTQRDGDGTFSTKLGWLPRKGFTGTLRVRGERLDASSPPMRVLAVYWGHDTQTGRGSWATPVVFPSEGCWRITGRVGDISLSYVVRVVGV
jgi:hypothetical protein